MTNVILLYPKTINKTYFGYNLVLDERKNILKLYKLHSKTKIV